MYLILPQALCLHIFKGKKEFEVAFSLHAINELLIWFLIQINKQLTPFFSPVNKL